MMMMIIICRYLITGIAYAFLVGVVPAGPLLDALKFFEIILTPQVIIILLSSYYCHYIIIALSSYNHHTMSHHMIINMLIIILQAILITSVRAVLALVNVIISSSYHCQHIIIALSSYNLYVAGNLDHLSASSAGSCLGASLQGDHHHTPLWSF